MDALVRAALWARAHGLLLARLATGAAVGLAGALVFSGAGGGPAAVTLFGVAFYCIGGALADRPGVSDEPEPEYEAPPEPVDACGHDAKAVPVTVDVDRDGEPDVIGWLCTEDGCGARVSHAEAVRRNLPKGTGEPLTPSTPTHLIQIENKVLGYRADQREFARAWRDIPYGEPLPSGVYDEHGMPAYVAVLKAGSDAEKVLREAEARIAIRRRSAVGCRGYREVAGRVPGSVVRHYAVPGECLCGSCPAPDEQTVAQYLVAHDVETEEVRSFDGQVVLRLATGSIRTGGVVIGPDGISRDVVD